MDIAHRWQQFGRALHIRQEKLDEIKAEVGSVPRECLTKTIQEFLKKNYDWKEHGEPSWRLVVIAVGHKVGGANTELALQIAKDHPTKCELFFPNSRVPVTLSAPIPAPPKKRSGSTSVRKFDYVKFSENVLPCVVIPFHLFSSLFILFCIWANIHLWQPVLAPCHTLTS